MSQIEYIYATAKKINAGKYVTQKEISTAQNYLHTLTLSNQYPGSIAEAKTIGSILATALPKAPK